MTTRKRAPAGHTYDPCPGCQETHVRKKGALCAGCTSLLESARASVAAARASTDMCAVIIPEYWHWLPNLGRHRGESGDRESREALQQALLDMMMACATRVPEGTRTSDMPPGPNDDGRIDYWLQGGESVWSNRNTYLVPKAIIEPVRRLHTALMGLLGSVAEKNRLAGQSLLLGLAAGDLSINDFNEQTVPLSERRR